MNTRSSLRTTVLTLVTVAAFAACGGTVLEHDDTPDTGGSGGAVSSGGKTAANGGKTSAGGRTGGGAVSGGGIVGAGGGPLPYGGTPSYGGYPYGGTPSYGGYPTGGAYPVTGGSPGTGGVGAGGSYVSTAGLDRYCKVDSDCLTVIAGDMCSCESCPLWAVTRDAKPKFDSAVQSARAYCGGASCDAGACKSEQRPTCTEDGQCWSRPTYYVHAEDFDHGCTTDTDCTTMPEGEICDACKCPTAPVSHAGYAVYKQYAAGQHCNPQPVSCNCPNAPAPHCGATDGGGRECMR